MITTKNDFQDSDIYFDFAEVEFSPNEPGIPFDFLPDFDFNTVEVMEKGGALIHLRAF